MARNRFVNTLPLWTPQPTPSAEMGVVRVCDLAAAAGLHATFTKIDDEQKEAVLRLA